MTRTLLFTKSPIPASLGVDGLGRKTSMTDSNANTTGVVYDLGGRQVATVDGRGKRTTTSYDAMDNVTEVKDANGWTTMSAYDDRARRPPRRTRRRATATGHLRLRRRPGVG